MNDRSKWQRIAPWLACLAVACTPGNAAAEPFGGPAVFEGAAIHGDQIAFACGGRLWLVSSQGGTARPITSSAAHDSLPCFAPDGSHLAFLRRSERLSGSAPASPDDPPLTVAVYDVYLCNMATGEARRMTHHPARDFPVGWTVDSKRVLIDSEREGTPRLFTMSAADQLPTALPLPSGYCGCFSPDEKRLAYLPRSFDYLASEFRHYRGGKCSPLWIVDLASSEVAQITDGTSNVRDPMWIGERIFFLADRDGSFDLHAYDTSTKAIKKLTALKNFGARGAATDGKSIVLAGDGSLLVFDLESQVTRRVAISIERGESALRPRIVNAIGQVQSYALDPNGAQAVVSARGDVFLVDTVSGRATNVTKTSGVAEREARISPDGKRLAYFSDVSGEYALHVRGIEDGKETALAIESQPSYYREIAWSPDGKFVAFSDKRLAAWLADLSAGTAKTIDQSGSSAQDLYRLSWSPDGRYVAYAKYGDNRLPRVHLHDVRDGTHHAVTPEGCHATWPVFDKSGRYLYFLSSANAAASDFAWGVMAGVLAQPLVVRQLGAVVLHAGEPAPVLGRAPNLAVNWKTSPQSSAIDFDGIESRIAPIDVGRHSPSQLAVGEPGVVYMSVEEWSETPGSGEPPNHSVYRLDLRSPAEIKKVIPLAENYAVSYDGKTILCGGPNWRIAKFQGAKTALAPFSLSALPAPVDREREWKQIFHETWRFMRDYFYDPHHHGLDWTEVERHYAEFLPGLRSREELNVLLRRMLGHVSVSHLGVGGGDVSSSVNEPEPVGLLGADLEISDGLYRIRRMLRGGPFDAAAQLAPLAQLGAEVADGEYLFAIDDEPLDAKKNIYSALRGKASRPVRLLVGKTPDRASARTLRVVPLLSETALRMADWAQRNARIVHEMSDGRLGYFHMRSFGTLDIQTFFRGYFANRAKPGMVIDQRHNGGGITPDYFIEMLARRPLYYYRFREGDDLAVPVNGREGGATVLVIDDDNASAAETFAFMFQLGKIGPLVGGRTFGAGIGPYGAASAVPMLVDGGRLRIPSRGAYDPRGVWGIENEGVRPDVAVDILPRDWLAGRDPQLEAAIQAGLEALKDQQPAAPRRPEFPVHP